MAFGKSRAGWTSAVIFHGRFGVNISCCCFIKGYRLTYMTFYDSLDAHRYLQMFEINITNLDQDITLLELQQSCF